MADKSDIHILAVDDEPIVRKSLKSWFTEAGYSVDVAESGKEALALLSAGKYDIFLLDIRMPGMDGLELQRHIQKVHPDAIIIIITAYGSVETAVQALKQGAYDYITKPFDPDELEHLIGNAVERKHLLDANIELQRQIDEMSGIGEIVGESAEIKQVQELIKVVSETDATVLVRGESGTGKELVARAIHANSPRRYMPMVVVNCGALPEGVLESELFGHEKGSFTGAQYRRKGKFELADGGTVFLDEIGDISPKTQADLLRVLEEKTVSRVGGSRPIPVDFRVVAATNRDLEAAVAERAFREDLYYRLNVFEVHVPPLRERKEDIPLLAEHFLHKISRGMSKKVESISPQAVELLCSYNWPGNVRELRNAIERAMVICRDNVLEPEHFMLQKPGFVPAGSEKSLAGVEQQHIQEMLEECDWNISLAARLLEIDRVTLYNKIKKYGLKRTAANNSGLPGTGG